MTIYSRSFVVQILRLAFSLLVESTILGRVRELCCSVNNPLDNVDSLTRHLTKDVIATLKKVKARSYFS